MIVDCKCPHCGGEIVLSMRAPVKADADPTAPVRRIQQEEATAAGITVDELLSRRMASKFVNARHKAIWRAAQETNYSLPRLGRLFHRDHTTILSALRRYAERHAD